MKDNENQLKCDPLKVELIVLTREQYQANIQEVVITTAKYIFDQLSKKDRPVTVKRAQAAKLIGKSKSTISKMILDQRIRTTADGSAITYTEIERYLNEPK